MDTKLIRRPATSPAVDCRPGRARSVPITLEHLCAAVDATPGTRLGTWLSPDPAEQLQLGVEVYDPGPSAWRILVALVDGEARVARDDLEDRQSPTCRAVVELARLLDACLVTEDGVVLLWGGEREQEQAA